MPPVPLTQPALRSSPPHARSDFGLTHPHTSTGSIPTQLGALEEMGYEFRLDYNKLSGGVPTQLGKLKYMTYYFSLR